MSVAHVGARLLLVASMSSGCARPEPGSPSWNIRFGPVISSESIVGHVIAGRTAWVATGGDAVVRIDLDRERHTRSTVHPLADGEHIWGLARTGPDEMWALAGRGTLIRFTEDGTIQKRIALQEPHVGVFAAGRELLFQIMNFEPPVDALQAGFPGGARRRPWGGMRTRALPLGRGAVAALNLVSCGGTTGRWIPCWFPDQAAVTLAEESGLSREIPLEGLPVVAPEILLASDNPKRPVRDAFVSAGGDLWVLGSGDPPEAEMEERPGGWLLARYDDKGRLFRRLQLPQPARLVLGAAEDRCLVLSWDGRVVEVRP